MQQIIAWLLQCGMEGTPYQDLLTELCERIVAAGVPMLRVNITMRSYHPQVGAFLYRWNRTVGTVHEQFERRNVAGDGWATSPLKYVIDNQLPEFRIRLTPENEPFDFPVLYELRDQGATDYLATLTPFQKVESLTEQATARLPMGVLVTWASDDPDGFSAQDLDDIRAILPALGLALKSSSNGEMARDLLAAYLGGDAGARVLSGEIMRGSVETIRTAILYFDLQSFTRLTETLEAEPLIAMLNDYFGEIVELVEAHGGNVLKFMGDGLLATFPDTGAEDGRLASIDAVAQIRETMAQINARRVEAGQPVTGFSAALHAGEVLYGNIGAAHRLDFTVIGPAVNAAARILGMCSALDQDILISAGVARPALDDRPALVSLGQYRLRGVSDRVELFTLD